MLTDDQGILILMAYRGYVGYCGRGNTALFTAVYRDGTPAYVYVGHPVHLLLI